jgi:hypothetical protein
MACSAVTQKDESAYVNYRNISQCMGLEASQNFIFQENLIIITLAEGGHFRLSNTEHILESPELYADYCPD